MCSALQFDLRALSSTVLFQGAGMALHRSYRMTLVPGSRTPAHPSPQRTVQQVLGFSSSSSSSCENRSSFVLARRAFMTFSLSVVTSAPAQALENDFDVGLTNGQLRSCEGGTPCVSTSAFRSPSRFMPPWSYLNSKESAYDDLLKALERMGAHIIERDDDKYVYATATSATDKDDVDDLEFLFVGNQVCYRSSSRKSVPDPPFCWWSGCINGPRNRGRMEALRDELGWISMETDEEKVWVPLLLH